MPMVTVVIPAFNQERFLRRAVDSVLAQTYDDLELIIVDDESTDNTREVAASIDDPRVRYIWQKNRGVSAARNAGVQASSGEYIAFLDADDTFISTKLEAQVQALDPNPDTGLVASGWYVVDVCDSVRGEERPWLRRPALDVSNLLFECPFIPSTIMVRRSALLYCAGFNEDFRIVQDWELFLRMAALGVGMAWVPEILSCYRMHDQQRTRDARSQKLAMITVLDNFFSDASLSAPVLHLREQAYARVYLREAPREFRFGQIEDARSDLVAAVRLDPGLMDLGGQQIFQALVAHAAHPLTPDPIVYIETAFGNLPSDMNVLRRRRREAHSATAMARFFTAHTNRDWSAVRRSFVRGVSLDPSWLCNRGVLAIIARACLNFSPRLNRYIRHASS